MPMRVCIHACNHVMPMRFCIHAGNHVMPMQVGIHASAMPISYLAHIKRDILIFEEIAIDM
jgi:hypothetical protein